MGMESDLKSKIAESSALTKEAEELVDQLCKACVSNLDSYLAIISECVFNREVTNQELDGFILGLPLYIYYASSTLERLGLREDVSAVQKKEAVQKAIATSQEKSMNKKVAEAELSTMEETMVNIIFQCAYKECKAKIETAYEILASCKKVMSRRIEELKVANSDTGRNKTDG